MASVQEEVTCPQCGDEHAFMELDCRTCEEYVQCKECGYCFTSKDGEQKGYGAYHIDAVEGFGQFGTLGKGAKLKDFLKHIQSLGDKVNVDGCFVTKWSDKRKKVEKFTIADLIALDKKGKI